MKILLQPEAKTISNYELAKNQEYLLNLLNKIACLKLVLNKKISSYSR